MNDLKHSNHNFEILFRLVELPNTKKIQPEEALRILREEIQNHRIAVPNPMCKFTLSESTEYKINIIKLIDLALKY